MQADLYLAVTPADELLVYIEKGVGSKFEAFAIYRGLPYSGMIKAGRFIPAYGWRFADHKAYSRDYLGFSQYPSSGKQWIEDAGARMPLGGPYLSSEDIQMIKEWINDGAENN